MRASGWLHAKLALVIAMSGLHGVLSRRLRVDASGGIYRVTDPASLPRESVARSANPIIYGQARVSATGRVSQRVDVVGGYTFEGVRVIGGDNTPGFVHTPYAEAMSRTRLWYWPNTTPLLGGPPWPSSDSVQRRQARQEAAERLTARSLSGPVHMLCADSLRAWG